MSNCNDIAEILRRNGLDQPARYDAALDPASVKLLGFGLEEWMKFAHNLAEQVNYYDESNAVTPDGDWQDFFPGNPGIVALITSLSEENKLTPHLALFVCFIYLLGDSAEKLNGFTKRHLDFYYSEVLQLPRLSTEPDRVSVIFGMAKNFTQELLAKGTELDAGDDLDGKKLVYELTDELALNQAVVGDLKNVCNPVGAPVTGSYALRASATAASYDGNGAAFHGSDVSWYPFGYAGTPENRPLLNRARTGFAVASNTLRLSEGTRRIAVQAEFKLAVAQTFSVQDLVSTVSVYYTGEKGWEGPFRIDAGGFSMSENNGAAQSYATGTAGKLLTLCLELQPDAKPSVPYSKVVHGGNYATQEPVFRFEIDTDSQSGYAIYAQLTEPVSSLKLKLSVSGIRKVVLENDNGTLNADKPFYPFTTNPVTGSSFSIFSEEVFGKKWKHLDLKMQWKNTPNSFPEHYRAYDSLFNGVTTLNWAEQLVSRSRRQHGTIGNVIRYSSIVGANDYFKAYPSIFAAGDWRTTNPSGVALFKPEASQIPGRTDFYASFGFDNNGYDGGDSGPLRLSLKQSFLQELFPKIYALAFTSTNPNVDVPNQPYVPFADELVLDYTATDDLVLGALSAGDFAGRSVQLFHLHPFGESEEHGYLKSASSSSADCSVAPLYCKGGELYIGLQNAGPLQQVSLLIQVLEGSENPLADTFEGTQKVHWHILCENNWKELDSSLLIADETDNFLRSGLVKVKIPAQATDTNTLLPPGMTWLRAKIHKSYDAVCRVLGVHAQAATAAFNRENELSHLEKGIPAETISKLVNRLSAVKSIEQPYSSYGGRAAESDVEYYRRVSERLRHKHRAINQWDYEHIVLQEFPEIYKVKCLNHTCDCSYQSGGNVTLMVIPDTLRRNVFDNYQPRVSKATLNEIEKTVSRLNSLHVKTHVVNPDYEEVKISLKVKFHPQFDESLYIGRLNDDISRFLSPWAFDESEKVRFGEKLYLSVLIDFAEELEYVDYLEDVRIYHKNVLVPVAEPSSPGAILVSARKHEISTDVKSCSTTNSATESCQL